MDLFTREVIGVNISRFHNRELVLGALIDTLNKTRRVPKYIHSDQGSEYDSKDFVDFVKSKKVIISMSRKSHPWENGHQESFFSTLKLELGDINRFETEGELIENIYHTVYYYNNRRIHTKLKTAPVNFRNRFKNLYTS
jgi:transposase InsO family protein